MEWMMSNWYYFVFAILVMVACSYAVMTGKVKEWLKYAVVYAERALGEGTGQLKLREVYDLFVIRFPMFSKIVPFDIFSKWVDLSLEWMKEQLDKNVNIKEYVEG